MKEIFGFYGMRCTIKYAKKAAGLNPGEFEPVIDNTLFYNSVGTDYVVVEIQIPPLDDKWKLTEDTSRSGALPVLKVLEDNEIFGSRSVNGKFILESQDSGIEYEVFIKTDPKMDVSGVEEALINDSGVVVNSYVIIFFDKIFFKKKKKKF